MKPRFIAITVAVMMLFCLLPATAFAASYDLVDGGVYDITSYASGDVLNIPAGASVTLSGTQAVQVVCGEGVHLTLSGATINDNGMHGACPVSFTGSGNTLTLTADTNNQLIGYAGAPGIRVASGTQLTIDGSGWLHANGGVFAAAIGGGNNENSGSIVIQIGGNGGIYVHGGRYGAGFGGGNHGDFGSINISSGGVMATGGEEAAGIGGGSYGNGGTVDISGGYVTARSDGYGAGIGGGFQGAGGTINISGGTVNASSAGYGAGIGGGAYAGSDTINISGGSVRASSFNNGAGIGGGWCGNGGIINISGSANVRATGGPRGAGIGGCGWCVDSGSINISGGIVYATAGRDAQNIDVQDIGRGSGSLGGSLTISGEAAVFLRNDSCITPVNTTTHSHLTFTTDTKDPYGYTIPPTWTPPFGSYLRVYTLSYNVNNGSGTVPSAATQLYNTTAAVAGGSGLSRENYEFNGWNTAADGSGTNYDTGSAFTFTADTTLYAKWKVVPTLKSSVASGKIYTGGRIKLTPNVTGGTWSFDSAFFKRNGNTFTGLKEGTSAITYTIEGQSVSYTVTISKSKLPPTGQDFTWVFVLLGLSVFPAAAAAVYMRRSVNNRR